MGITILRTLFVLSAIITAFVSSAAQIDPSAYKTAFSSDGIETFDPTGNIDNGNAVAFLSDGSAIIAGHGWNGSDHDVILMNVLPDGTLNTSFGTSGTVVDDLGNSDQINDVHIDADDNIYAFGTSQFAGGTDILIVKYNSSGTRVATFGTNGIQTITIGSNEYGTAITENADGNLIYVGSSTNGDADAVVGMIDSNGNPVAAFNGGNPLEIDEGGDDQYGAAVALDAAGDIYIAFTNDDFIFKLFGVAKVTKAGALDTSFDGDGIKLDDVFSNGDQWPGSILVNDEGYIYVTGYGDSGSFDREFGYAVYEATGADWAGFNTSGDFSINISIGNSDEISNSYIDRNGLLVSFGISGNDIAIARIEQDATPDNFNASGYRTYDPTGNSEIFGEGNISPDGSYWIVSSESNDIVVTVMVGSSSAPTLIAPLNGSEPQGGVVNFSWESVGGASSYDLQISGNAEFSSTIVDESGITGTSYSRSGLGGGAYYWRVRAEGGGLTSDWSQAFRFTYEGVEDFDGDGSPDSEENQAPNGGDGNGDGIPDFQQPNVATLTHAGVLTTLFSVDCDTLRDPRTVVTTSDREHLYPFGAFAFHLDCAEAEVRFFFHGAREELSQLSYRKLSPDNRWFDFTDTTHTMTQIGDLLVPTITLTLTDGGIGDYDGIENGVIVDPGGPSVPLNSTIPVWDWWWVVALGAGGWLVWRRSR